MLNFSIFTFICLILLYCVILVDGSTLSLTDITNNRLYKYNLYGDSSGVCSYSFVLNISDSSLNSTTGLGLFGPPVLDGSIFNVGVITLSLNSILFNIVILNFPIGSTNPNGYTITGTNGFENVSTTIFFTCSVLPINKITLKKLPLLGPNVFGGVGSQFKIGGLTNTYTGGIGTTNSLLKPIGLKPENYFLMLQIPSEIIFNPISSFFDGQLYIYMDNYHTNKTIEIISDFQLYPNQNEIILIGMCFGPVFTFKSNSPKYIPSYGISVNANYNINSFVFRPISSIGSTITYMGFFDYSQNEGILSTYAFHAQNETTNSVRASFSLNIKNKLQYNLTQTIGNISQTNDIVTVEFVSKVNNNFAAVYYNYGDQTVSNEVPFGYIFGCGVDIYEFSADSLLPEVLMAVTLNLNVYMQPYNFSSGFSTALFSPTSLPVYDQDLIFGNSSITQLYGSTFLLRIEISYTHKIYKISFAEKTYNLASLASGTIYGGVFELVFNIFSNTFSGLTVNDHYKYFNFDQIYSTTYPPLPKPFFNQDFDINEIQNVSILFKTMNVTNQISSNILYFSYGSVNIDKNTPIGLLVGGPLTFDSISLTPKVDISMYDKLLPAKWNSTSNMFQVEFTLAKNSQPGYLPFALVFSYNKWVLSNQMGEDAQFKVISDNMDLYGPIFENIEKFPASISLPFNNLVLSSNPDAPPVKFGWILTIKDDSGFKNGSVRVRGLIDGSVYNFPLQATSNIYKDKYHISLDTVSMCATQDYIITDVLLYDVEDNQSSFSIKYSKDSPESSLYNPFINYLNDSLINRISVDCLIGGFNAITPTIKAFDVSPNVVDVGLLDAGRTITFTMKLSQNYNGLKDGNLPTFYLSSVGFEKISCPDSKVIVIDKYNSTFECKVVLPIGFGHPFGMLASVYGLVNRNGYYSGYSSHMLKANGFTSKIFTAMTIDQPIIIGSERISTLGGSVWIYGRAFNDVKLIVTSLAANLTIKETAGNSAIHISGIPKLDTVGKFSIQLFTTKSTKTSNEFFITPYATLITPPNEIPTLPPTTTPLPTNKPQKCIGDPECGGSSNGYCSDTGCVCHPPWIGTSCTSKILIVPPPTTNITNPSTEIPIINQDDSGETSNYLFKSLISIISIRELSFDFNVVKTHTFDKWIYTPIDENSSKYFTSIQVTTSIATTTTNVTVILQWFKNQQIVNFANENITMQPSSMKYTVEISQYNFETNLNHLQLVMMASLESSKTNDICSTSEFGETSNGIDNSNYVKIQIDNKSLYGRFIKRAIVDSTITSISNTPLDESFNPIKKASQNQAYIGITIPHFNKNITIDPDFSVLVDNNTPSSSTTSSPICNNSKSGLTNPQLISIIVVCSFVFIVAVLIFAFVLIRRHKHSLFLLKIKDIKMFRSK